MRNEHLQRLAIILSCLGLINTTITCGPESEGSREYSVQLCNNLAGDSTDIPISISLTQEQRDLIDGTDLEWFKTLLDATLNNDGDPNFYNFNAISAPGDVKIEDRKIKVATVMQQRLFQVKGYRLYICDPRFKHKVSMSTYADRLPQGNCREISDLGSRIRDIDRLDIDDSCIFIDQTSITNDEEMTQFRDFIYFLQELSERRDESIQDTFKFLTNFDSKNNPSYTLARYPGNKDQYVLTSECVLEGVFHKQYEFFLKDETKRSTLESKAYDVSDSTCNSFYSIKFPAKSKMILERVKFLEWEYTLKNRCYLLNGESLSYIKTRLDSLTRRLPKLAPSSTSAFKAAGERILREIFAPIEQELSFVESLSDIRLENAYADYAYMEFLNYIRSCGQPNRFSLIAHNISLRKSDK